MDDPSRAETTLIRPRDVLFIFTCGVIPASGSKLRPRVIGGWVGRLSLAPETVFLRTRQGIYQSDYRSLKAFARASAIPFTKMSRSVWVNLSRVESTALRHESPKKLGFRVVGADLGWGVEYVVVSRTFLACARCIFGIGAGVRPCPLRRCDSGDDPSTGKGPEDGEAQRP